jgi:phage/plasmid-like protein (TIGR03299 family)
MGLETAKWYNTMCLIGMAAERGNAWHYMASEQGMEPNHYDGPIPIDDVRRRLLNWNPVERPVYIGGGLDGETPVLDPTRKAIVRDDNHALLSITGADYKAHGYDEYLLDGLAQVLDINSGDLVIGSAVLLKNGAVMCVQIETPETIVTPSGVAYRPHIAAATSLDRSMKTTYKGGNIVVVCDNTMTAYFNQPTPQYKLGHTSRSVLDPQVARENLEILHKQADGFTREVEELIATTVTDAMLIKFLDEWAPITKVETGIKRKKDEERRGKLLTMWNEDERVAPYKGTAWGALALTSTYRLHERSVRNVTRGERNRLDALTGKTEVEDKNDHRLLKAILA